MQLTAPFHPNTHPRTCFKLTLVGVEFSLTKLSRWENPIYFSPEKEGERLRAICRSGVLIKNYEEVQTAATPGEFKNTQATERGHVTK